MIRLRALIVSGSHIIRTGISSILEEKETEVLFSEDKHIPIPVPADVILLDPRVAHPEELEKQMENTPVFERPKIILLDWSVPVKYPDYPYRANVSGTKSQLFQEIEKCLDVPKKKSATTNNSDPLSNREKNILRLVALGKTNKDIADQLFISTHTVITHRKNITRKLGIKTVSGLTVYAILNNIIHLEEMQ